MNILVIGSGGREHAICRKLSTEDNVKKIFCIPGNAGIAEIAECVRLDITDNAALLRFAKYNGIDLTIVGPEVPLVNGIADHFEKEGLKIFGPRKDAAMLEGSKGFSKMMMEKSGIPTARYDEFSEMDEAIKFIRDNSWARIVKADGLAAGKGVFVCDSEEEAIRAVRIVMQEGKFGESGKKIIIEEKLVGEEASFLAFTDGQTVVPLLSSQDHKRVFDFDKGENTGGMGAYCPAPIVTDILRDEIMESVMNPIVEGMRKEGIEYKGILYAGIMVTAEGPKVLEFNCRFGDPEAQPLLSMLKSDLSKICLACIEGRLKDSDVEFFDGSACCVVLASGGYPGKYEKGKMISGIGRAEEIEGVKVFFSGTKRLGDEIITDGGRVLGVTARGKTIKEAIDLVYEAVNEISFEGMHYRKDIGKKVLR